MYKGDHNKNEIEITKEVSIFKNKYFEVFNDEVIFPSGTNGTYLRVKFPGESSVAILPVLENGNYKMIKTFRHSARGFGLEIPKGYCEKDEDPLSCAKRELLEETGLVSDEITYVGYYHESPSTLQGGLHCYIAKNCKQLNKLNLESTEAISNTEEISSISQLNNYAYNDAITELVIMKYELQKNHEPQPCE